MMDGFQDDTMLIRMGGRGLLHRERPSTRAQTGYTASAAVDMPAALVEIEIDVPGSLPLWCTFARTQYQLLSLLRKELRRLGRRHAGSFSTIGSSTRRPRAMHQRAMHQRAK